VAQESKRACGYRKVGGLYLCGDYMPRRCDRIPYELIACPVCGQGIKLGRGFTQIDAFNLFGVHKDCQDNFPGCPMCDPPDTISYIMTIGERFYNTPQEFIDEGLAQGISKRIPFIPKDFQVGETYIYLAHPKGKVEVWPSPTNPDETIDVCKPAIFTAFQPQQVEMLVWESQLEDKKGERYQKKLGDRGITIIPIKNGDVDHKPPRRKRRKF